MSGYGVGQLGDLAEERAKESMKAGGDVGEDG